ncbi:hypothetical protein [Caballeronia glebae]|uniref:hypothetical protein n=1 Tax=Caballeronia glebae TaxID=1777143 RepID=UPI0038B6D707
MSHHSEAEAELVQATFPFDIRPNWLPSDARMRKAEAARRIFEELWLGCHEDRLTPQDIQDTFFKGISDLISYREGWHSGRYWSVNAWKRALATNAVTNNGLIAEHVLPRTAALNYALGLKDERAAGDFVWNASFYCMITKEENDALTRAGFAAEGNENDPWERYSRNGSRIMILDVEDAQGRKLIPSAEREKLKKLAILEPWKAEYGQRHALPPLAATPLAA